MGKTIKCECVSDKELIQNYNAWAAMKISRIEDMPILDLRERTLYCPVHVGCDDCCMALEYPKTSDEILKSFLHYKYHSFSHGCSHGS